MIFELRGKPGRKAMKEPMLRDRDRLSRALMERFRVPIRLAI